MTENQDFKALVRERMAKTGESYTTARQRLLEQRAVESDLPSEQATPKVPGQFRLADDPTAAIAKHHASTTRMYEAAGVAISDATVEVWMGDPATFSISIPRERIVSAEPLPDRATGTTLGVHGRRGRWLVNATYTGLVRLQIDPAVNADFRPRNAMPEGTAEKTPRLLRFVLRERTPKVRELTISVDDPAGFIEQLGL